MTDEKTPAQEPKLAAQNKGQALEAKVATIGEFLNELTNKIKKLGGMDSGLADVLGRHVLKEGTGTPKEAVTELLKAARKVATESKK